MKGDFLWACPGRLSLFLILFFCVVAVFKAFGTEFFVTPNGSSNGSGTIASPWDLQTALSQPTNVAPGDVIWLKGGIYRRNNAPTGFSSSLAGAPDQPITVRQAPGERAIVDGYIIQQTGGWVNYWGFEIMNSHSNRVTSESGSFPTAFHTVVDGRTNNLTVTGFDLRAPNVKLINLVIHDAIGGGIEVSTSATEPEIHGVVCYYNGWQGCDRGHGHGLYIQSLEPSSARVAECLFLANYGLGIQATGNSALVDNLHFEGNAVFLNGILARRHQGNFLLGPLVGLAKNPVIIRNFIYDNAGSSSDSNLGYSGGSSNAIILDNYFQTGVQFSEKNNSMVLASNTFLGGTLFLERTNFPDNAFLDTPPQTNLVEIRTNKYEPGRAHIIVYNWENQPSIAVDLSDFLPVGIDYEIRNAQNYFGAPLASGIFEGGSVDLPLSDLAIAKPVAMNTPVSSAPAFNAFILKRRETSSDPNYTNTAPTISSIPNVVTEANVPSEAVAFLINDAEIPADFLNVSLLSSNPELVPHKNIHIDGMGTDRVLTIVPAPDKTGSSTITLAVSDGFLSAETTFTVEVLPGENPPSETNIFPANLFLALDGTNVEIRVEGVPNVDYQFRASSNLVNWRFIGTASTDCDGIGNFIDNDYLSRPERFYRVVQQP